MWKHNFWVRLSVTPICFQCFWVTAALGVRLDGTVLHDKLYTCAPWKTMTWAVTLASGQQSYLTKNIPRVLRRSQFAGMMELPWAACARFEMPINRLKIHFRKTIVLWWETITHCWIDLCRIISHVIFYLFCW